METIALFGGSFDPPHIGHEAIVKAILDLEYIDKVVVMPTFLNPFKSKSHASSQLRLRWLREIFLSYKNVEINSYEVDLNKMPHLQKFHELYTKNELEPVERVAKFLYWILTKTNDEDFSVREWDIREDSYLKKWDL